MRRRVVSASLFFPRGGSAHVIRALATHLTDNDWDVTIVSGSVHEAGPHGDARRFYAGLDLVDVDFTAALHASDPMDPPGDEPPMHPSFEDRPAAADRVFASLDDAHFERQVEAWARALERAGAADADVLHLHHLTPLNAAAARVAADVPVVGHLHGTELLMLEAIARDPGRWPFAAAWRERLRGWAARCERLIVLSDTQVERAVGLLGIDPARCVLVPNGFDPETFTRRPVDRGALWRRCLVDEPR